MPPVACSKGRYQDKTGHTTCKPCNSGDYNDKTGQKKCKTCTVGHSCYWKHIPPVACSKGKYQDKTGQTVCKNCNSGDYNDKTGQTKCKTCPGGHACYWKHLPPAACSKGTYQDKTGQTKCKHCNSGDYNVKTGQTNCKTCPVGHKCYWKHMPPVACSKGTYSPPGSTKCYNCPPGNFCSGGHILPVSPTKDAVLKKQIQTAASYTAKAHETNSAYIFPESNGNAIILSFRDKVDRKWWINIWRQHTYTGCQACAVHWVFFKYYISLKDDMLAKVSARLHSHPNSKVLVTGHSFGGAMATLAAIDLVKAGYKVDLITFGAPRVGNTQFSQYADETMKGLNIRVTNKEDVVTVSPPQASGFRHSGIEVHYTDDNTAYKMPPKTDIDYNRKSGDDNKMVNYEKLN